MKSNSPLKYVLQALIPYSEANLLLSFKPAQFFKQLDKLEVASPTALRSAYYRAMQKGLIEIHDNTPRLTKNGQNKLQLYQAKTLPSASILLIFDIPEQERWKRRRLRALLKELSFKQVQKSVWETSVDCIAYLRMEIEDQDLQQYIKVYEASQLKIY